MGKAQSENAESGLGRHGTAPPLTAHRGRSRPAEKKDGATVVDAVTKACQAILGRFIGNPDLFSQEMEIPKLVRTQARQAGGGSVGDDTPDAVIVNRFRNILSSGSLPKAAATKWEKIKKNRPPELLNKQERRNLRRMEAAKAAGSVGPSISDEKDGGKKTATKKRAHEEDDSGEMKLHKPKKCELNISRNQNPENYAKASRGDLHAGR